MELAMLLCSAMLLTGITGCGNDTGTAGPKGGETEQESEFDETVEFTITDFYSMYQANAGHDIENDPYINWVCDKFNVKVDAWACDATSAPEMVRVWVNGGTMPDVMAWPDLEVAELNEYADQGLIQALPENWEERWPNLARMVQNSGYGELVKVDGLTFGIPHSLFGNFNQMENPVDHHSIYFRKDWAKQVGMENLGADKTIKLSELKEYLQKVKDAGLCDNPTISGDSMQLRGIFRLSSGLCNDEFLASDNGYVWVPGEEGYTEHLKTMQSWYKEGLIDPDFYVKTGNNMFMEFAEGLSAAIFHGGGVGNYQDLLNNALNAHGFEANNMDERNKLYDVYGMAAVRAEDGTVFADGIYSYWMIHTFSPDCDEAKMERILYMFDWYCTKEGQASERLAIPGQDWTMDEGGNITVLNEDIISGEYKVCESRFFNVWGYAGDDLAYARGIPGRYEYEQQTVLDIYDIKTKGTIFKKDDKVESLATDAMKVYSVDVNTSAINMIVGNKDIDSEWPKFVESNRPMWEPVVEDLNQ